MCAEEPNRGAACSESRPAGSDSGSTFSSRSRAHKGKARRSRSARGVVSGSDGYNQTAPGVRKARAAATSPATLCAPPNRAVHPDCARTHRHGRDCVASPWALERARRHPPLPHPLGACRARHQMVADLHSALHRPFQESAPTRPVGRACPPQRPRTNAAVPITRFGSSVSDPRWPHPALREKRSHPRSRGAPCTADSCSMRSSTTLGSATTRAMPDGTIGSRVALDAFEVDHRCVAGRCGVWGLAVARSSRARRG